MPFNKPVRRIAIIRTGVIDGLRAGGAIPHAQRLEAAGAQHELVKLR